MLITRLAQAAPPPEEPKQEPTEDAAAPDDVEEAEGTGPKLLSKKEKEKLKKEKEKVHSFSLILVLCTPSGHSSSRFYLGEEKSTSCRKENHYYRRDPHSCRTCPFRTPQCDTT